ncbi:MAG: hypothetical protein DHS20C16_31790 [Phycisphaerae bacterium]|nr:MAG: hypothetical protein DHS20C16_31790 [Phycisphaerae bacterium]
MKHPSRRNAMTLIIVLAVMALIGGVVVGLTHHTATLHQQIRHQRMKAAARYCTHSANELLHRSPASIPTDGDPLKLEIDSLFAAGLKGTGNIQCATIDESTTCEIDVVVRLSRRSIRRRTPVATQQLSHDP